MDSLVGRVPEAHLTAWLWWLSVSALLLPALLGLAAMRVNHRIGELRTAQESRKAKAAESRAEAALRESAELQAKLDASVWGPVEEQKPAAEVLPPIAELQTPPASRGLLLAKQGEMTALLEAAPKLPVKVWITTGGEEVEILAGQMVTVLKLARLKTQPERIVLRNARPGVFVSHGDDQEAMVLASTIVAAFAAGGLEAEEERFAGAGGVIIHVGPMP